MIMTSRPYIKTQDDDSKKEVCYAVEENYREFEFVLGEPFVFARNKKGD